MSPPLCRYCGKPLRKRTKRFYVRPTPESQGFTKDDVVGVFKHKDEVQRATNEQVVSLKYHKTNGSWGEAGTVWSFTTWDGESYESLYGEGFFCTMRCAADFGSVFADGGYQTKAYAAALAKQG